MIPGPLGVIFHLNGSLVIKKPFSIQRQQDVSYHIANVMNDLVDDQAH